MASNKVLDAATTLLRKKQRNLFELAFTLPNYGVGTRVTRSIWRRPDCYWTLTRVQMTKQTEQVKRGKAWGVLTWRGVSEARERGITGTVKDQWHIYDPNFYKKFEDPSKWVQNQKNSADLQAVRNSLVKSL